MLHNGSFQAFDAKYIRFSGWLRAARVAHTPASKTTPYTNTCDEERRRREERAEREREELQGGCWSTHTHTHSHIAWQSALQR